MAWEGSTRKYRLPSNWATLRLRVLRRDSYRCQVRNASGVLCGAPAREVDHIVAGDNHDLSNLRAICTWHHRRKSSAEGNYSPRRRKRPSKFRTPERHPGLND